MSAIEVDTTRVPLLMHQLRLPAMARLWREFADRADKEGWPAARFFAAMAELEVAERGRRRIERHLKEAHLLPGKTLEKLRLLPGADAEQSPRHGAGIRRFLVA